MNGSFVQIHYHNRPGGVTTVMHRYADEFRRAGGNKDAVLLLCSHADGAAGYATVNVKDCAYRTYRSRTAFDAARNRLLSRLERIVTSPNLPAPVRVAGHNLNLCKNPALSSAFTELASRLGGLPASFRFFSVVHDLAEDGRTSLLIDLRLLQRRGISPATVAWPVAPNIKFVAVNQRTLRVFKIAGFSAALLPNPIDVPEQIPASRCNAVNRAISRGARSFDGRLPTLFYPSRVVSRKNPVEANMLASF